VNTVQTQVKDIRILVTDDNAAIHDDFRRILAAGVEDDTYLADAETLLFGDAAATPAHHPAYALEFALQGRHAVQCVKRARADGQPFAVAFIDMRMPPGWDGLETIERLWEEDPRVQIVICSAHSDYDWKDIFERLGHSDKLLILKKPFEPIEVLQSASALSRKWQHERALEAHVESLERVITARKSWRPPTCSCATSRRTMRSRACRIACSWTIALPRRLHTPIGTHSRSPS
jgi:CheY-like chemotaxis protein